MEAEADDSIPAGERPRADTLNPMLGAAAASFYKPRSADSQARQGTALWHIKDLDRRRQTVLTEGKNRSMVNSGLRFVGTLLPHVIVHPVFWAAVAGWIAGIVVGREDDVAEDFKVDFNMLFGVGAFLAFFTIFHLCECYRRWQNTFDHAMSAILALKSATLMLSSYISKDDYKYATDIVRYLNAAHLLAYVGVSDEYSIKLFREYNDEQQLLSQREVKEIETLDPEHGPLATSRCLIWSMQLIHACKENEVMHVTEIGRVEARILSVWSDLARLHDLNNQPIPLAYFNLLAILTFVYVPLSSFMLGFTFAEDWHISLVGMLMSNLSLVGITKLAVQFHDPIGSDLIDFTVFRWIDSTTQETRKMLKWGLVPPPCGIRKRTPAAAEVDASTDTDTDTGTDSDSQQGTMFLDDAKGSKGLHFNVSETIRKQARLSRIPGGLGEFFTHDHRRDERDDQQTQHTQRAVDAIGEAQPVVMGEVLSKTHELKETVTVTELYAAAARYDKLHIGKFLTGNDRGFNKERLCWIFQFERNTAPTADRHKEERRLAFLCAQAGILNLNDAVDYHTIMCGLAFFAEGTTEERLRFMFSLFMDPDGSDAETGAYFLDMDPDSDNGDRVTELLTCVIVGIMMHSGMEPMRWVSKTSLRGVTTAGWVEHMPYFKASEEAFNLGRTISQYHDKPPLFGLTDKDIMEFYSSTAMDPPGFIHYIINTGRYRIRAPRITGNLPRRVTKRINTAAGVFAEIRLSVEVEATPPLSFEWTKDGDPVLGATEPTLLIARCTEADAGVYHCWVRHVMGSEVSHRCLVKVFDDSVKEELKFRRQRAASTANAFAANRQGPRARLEAARAAEKEKEKEKEMEAKAEGEGEGAMVVAAATPSPKKAHDEELLNAAIADLRTMVPKLEAISHYPPASRFRHGKYPHGSCVAFVSRARIPPLPAGSAGELFAKPLRFRWFCEDEKMEGESDPVYVCHRATRKYYRLQATTQTDLPPQAARAAGFFGNSTESDTSRLPLDPCILSQSISKTVLAGNDVTLSLDVESSTTVSYQWFKDGRAFDNPLRFTQQLTLKQVSSKDEARYHCQIANDNGIAFTVPTVVQVDAGPEIDPKRNLRRRMNIPESHRIVLKISMLAGAPPFHYLWVKDCFPLDTANKPELIFDHAQVGHSGVYYCIVSNALGVVKSQACTVQVRTRLDWLCRSVLRCRCLRIAFHCSTNREFRKGVRKALAHPCTYTHVQCVRCGKRLKRRRRWVGQGPGGSTDADADADTGRSAGAGTGAGVNAAASPRTRIRGALAGAGGDGVDMVSYKRRSGGDMDAIPASRVRTDTVGRSEEIVEVRKAQLEKAFSSRSLVKLAKQREDMVVENAGTRKGVERAAAAESARERREKIESGAVHMLTYGRPNSREHQGLESKEEEGDNEGGEDDDGGGGGELAQTRKRQTMFHDMKARVHRETLRQQRLENRDQAGIFMVTPAQMAQLKEAYNLSRIFYEKFTHVEELECTAFLVEKYGKLRQLSRAQPLLFNHTIAKGTTNAQFLALLSLIDHRSEFVNQFESDMHAAGVERANRALEAVRRREEWKIKRRRWALASALPLFCLAFAVVLITILDTSSGARRRLLRLGLASEAGGGGYL
eukprot:g432.t1